MYERLFRSTTDKKIAGVCGGLGEYLKIDPVFARLAFVLLTFLNGTGLLIYIIMWIAVPERKPGIPSDVAPKTENGEVNIAENTSAENTGEIQAINKPVKNDSGKMIFGIILIALGILFLLSNFIEIFSFVDVFPLILIILGGILIWNSINNKRG